MILFDTDICIELLRGNKDIIKSRSSYDGEISVSFMSVAELYYGIEKSKSRNKNLIQVEEFLLSVNIIESDLEITKKFGELKALLSDRGDIIADADIFIASTAITKCEKLITGNVSHFNRIKELEIENWIR